MKKVFVILSIFLTVSILTALLPYPMFSRHTNLTQKEVYQINNFHETEITANTNQYIDVLDLNFEQINAIFPLFCEFEIFDMRTNQSFLAKRTGGKNHIDLEPLDFESARTVANISSQINQKNSTRLWDWKRCPVLVKINDFAYVPASIAYFPHGHSLPNNFLCGHLCLHFRGSCTDGTNEIDTAHQSCVSFAKKHAKEFLKNNF